MWVKGLDNCALKTSGSTVTMGKNNRSWVTDFAQEDGVYWAYWHPYLAGSLNFDVDLSEISCCSASGIYLVNANDQECSWGEKNDSFSGDCSRIEIMEANMLGFTAASYPCEDGFC